ncbi:NAD(P)H-dependent oxidoreductase [Crocinitomicaceae bacterium]|jgi:nitroreductase|nr:NAD(P)H-dependent oxidoreductase [Crocinitomicaceae bacterium]MDG1347957.1 NAD(P)H-dependent oxidoreductase [Crocinitomicaceae bacterium]MDG2465582.1 NAD(P)H-dependent oxidoreductase [Crocinitomicaceae bacterium]
MKNTIIKALEWRYAVKKYDASKKITEDNLQILKDSIRLAPTSYGLQPFKAIFIEDEKIREQLKGKSWGQTQVIDASHLVVFVAQKQISIADVDAYMQNVANSRGLKIEQTTGFGDYIKSSIAPMTEAQFMPWNVKQTYIALGMLMQTAAELRIDTTPMEGFETEAYDQILGLTEQGYTTAVVCALGFRHAEDGNQHQAKVRKSEEELFQTI